jgi:rare lipoprotein A (peptidoglycan hydrolase)
MPQFGNGRRGAALITLTTGAAALLVSSQLVFSTLFSGPSIASAESSALMDEHAFLALQQPASVLSTTSQMNAAVSTGQFEELVRPTPVPTVAPTPVPSVAPTPAPVAASQPSVFQTGVASTYGEGDGFEGNLTACGQVFHTGVVQVAHKSLPCGTLIRVEDSDTGRAVTAEVTDRGPYIPGRIVDLSWAAFKQLDATGPGLLNVKVYLLD